MNRIDQLFSVKKEPVLSVYCTAGYPRLNSTLEVMKALQDGGVDMIELGLPYSDPVADGPVIQQSSRVALDNGMNIRLLFEHLQNMRDLIHVPVILMGYFNPVLQYGMENFCIAAARAGADGIILPDLPLYEYESMYRQIFKQTGLHFIFIVTPETSAERIREIDEIGSGFIYAVSSSSTTGNQKDLRHQEEYFKRLREMKLKNPFLVGFGVKDRESLGHANRYSRGAIIGTAYINALEPTGEIGGATKEFLNALADPAF